MQLSIFKNKDIRTFTIISFTTGIFIVLFSFIGHFLTPTKLIPSSFTGGVIGLVSGTYLCFKQKTIDKANLIPVMLFTLIAFGVIAFVIVFNFNHPVLIVSSFFLIGLTSVISNNYFKKHSHTSKNKIYATAGFLCIFPALYFFIASILKFQLGYNLLFNFIDIFLNRANGQANFNAITPFLFGGGLFLSFILNAFSQMEISNSSKTLFGYKISGIRLQPLNLSILIITGCTGIIMASYIVFENLK